MTAFKTIGIMGREDRGLVESLQIVKEFLSTQPVTVILEEQVATLLNEQTLSVGSPTDITQQCDLVIVVGGDGSLLRAGRILASHDVAVLGVNRGRLGFLTDILPTAIIDKVGAVLQGHYTTEKRFLLDVFWQRNGQVIDQADALNDIVLNAGASSRMLEFDLAIDDQFVYHQRSDGLIIATPTGSTAYCLSGGGPIMHPHLDAVVLVPMFPHTLSSRPLVVDGNSEIKLTMRGSQAVESLLTCDGYIDWVVQAGDEIVVRKKAHQLQLIHPIGHSFYASCREKLGWSTKLGH